MLKGVELHAYRTEEVGFCTGQSWTKFDDIKFEGFLKINQLTNNFGTVV